MSSSNVFILLDERIFQILEKNNLFINIGDNTELQHISPRSSYLRIKLPIDVLNNSEFRELVNSNYYDNKRGTIYYTALDSIPKEAELNLSIIKHHSLFKKRIVYSIIFSNLNSELLLLVTSIENLNPFISSIIPDDYDVYINVAN